MATPLSSFGHAPVPPLSTVLYDDFFRDLTGGRAPYAYQQRMAKHLSAGTSDVLLTAPTGCGKTWSTLGPFLHARAVGRPFADRVLYALPLRALASSLKAEAERALGHLGLQVRVTIQTGDQHEDDLFDQGDIIFTTIDQLLSSYLHIPLSLPQRLANINAGTLVGSLVVFDEAHLLEPERALHTLLHLMGSHRSLARFVVATATLTSPAKTSLISSFRGRLIEEGPSNEEAVTIPVLAGKRRAWTRADRTLSADAVRALHCGGRTLVVVNTVAKAQEIGASLLRRAPEGVQILVLHSRFFPRDRAAVEQRLTLLFGPDAPPTNVILVATQVVEAGLDLSADLLLTEVAPANALVQRAGRCARYVAPRNKGEVVVFDLDRTERGGRRLGPYRSAESVLARTWDALAGLHQALLGASGERTLLETALADAEGAAFEDMQQHRSIRARDEKVRDAWRTGNLAALRELVRDVRAVPIFLADNPDGTIDLKRGPIAISIPTPTWQGFLSDVDQRGLLGAIKVLADDPVDESPWATRWIWRSMQDRHDWGDAYCLTSEFAAYDDCIGLRFTAATRPLPPVEYRGRAVGPGLHYAMETYRAHVTRVLAQAHRWLERHPVAVACCADRYGLSAEVVRGALLLAAGLHDTAKLDVKWQRAVRAWQTYKARHHGKELPAADACLAHTDYDPRTDRDEQQRAEFQRPNHAVEGALAVYALVYGWVADLGCSDETAGEAVCRCILTAISRHHSARATGAGSFVLVDNALDEILAPLLEPAIGGLPPPSNPELVARPLADERRQFDGCAFLMPEDPRHASFWPLYCFVVRGLRLSDQAATRETTAHSQAAYPPKVAP